MKVFALIINAVMLAAFTGTPVESSDSNALFRQPSLPGFGDHLYVQARAPVETFAMISWQKNPATADGKFVPGDWNVGEKTGLLIAGNLAEAQRGMRNRAGSTAAQMSGTGVGAYLNSADLSGGGVDAQGYPLPGSGGYKMMVTPQINFSPVQVSHLFRTRGDMLRITMDLQIPVAVCAQKKGSLTYVNPILVFSDPKRKVKISYIVGLFSSWATKKPAKIIENIAYDDPSHSWMIHCNLVPGIRWATMGSDSSSYQALPWKGWKHFSYSITRENFESALHVFREQQPDLDCSTDPADYLLQSFHLNAELTYQTAPTELGWSMRNAMILIEHK